MPKYHINPKTGRIGVCRAENNCPLRADDGTPAPHFNNKEDAQKDLEEKLAAAYKNNQQSMKKEKITAATKRQCINHYEQLKKIHAQKERKLKFKKDELIKIQNDALKNNKDINDPELLNSFKKNLEECKKIEAEITEAKAAIRQYEKDNKRVFDKIKEDEKNARKLEELRRERMRNISSCGGGGGGGGVRHC